MWNLSRNLDALVRAHVQQGTFSGSVLVARGDRVVLRKGYGKANLELGVPVTPEHAFRIGSVAKILTALAVLRLVDMGQLSVEDKLGAFVPIPDAEQITLHQLLSNTSGIADHITREDAAAWCGRPHSLPELLELIAQAPRLFTPGERFGYSNANWALLAAVLKNVTGQPFSGALTDLVLTPLQLTRTTVGIDHPLVPGSVSGYQLGEDGLRPAAHLDLSVEIGAGGLYSTVGDLHHLSSALTRDGFLTPETRGRMTSPVSQSLTQSAEPGASTGYGLGVMTGHRFGRAWLGHSGGTFGFSSFLTHYSGAVPRKDVTIIVLSNVDNGSAADLEQSLAALLFGKPYSLPQPAPRLGVPYDVPRDVLATYEGRYRTEYAGRVTDARITLGGSSDGAHLYVQFPLLAKARLRALSTTRFEGRLKGGKVIFDFVAEAGQVTGIKLDWSGQKLTAPKLEAQADRRQH